MPIHIMLALIESTMPIQDPFEGAALELVSLPIIMLLVTITLLRNGFLKQHSYQIIF